MADAAVVQHKLDRAKYKLVLQHPFFATLLLKRPLIETTSVPTMGVDAAGNIYYNPDFVQGLSEGQIIFGLAHEVMHRVGLHALRKMGRNHRKWNYATDAWINDTLRAAGVGEWIPHIVDIPGSKDTTSEHIYDTLPDNENNDWELGGLGGDLIPGDEVLDEETERRLHSEAMRDLAEAVSVAQLQGKLPNSLREYAEAILNVQVPWYSILERWMTSKSRVNQSWARPNRRYISGGMYLPSYDSQNAMGPMAIIVDISGSIGQDTLAEFTAHTRHVVEQVRPTKLYVVYVDDMVRDVQEFTADDMEITLRAPNGGGTDMREGLEWLRASVPDLEACLVFTDMMTPFPTRQYFPTIWVATTGADAPAAAGQTIHV